MLLRLLALFLSDFTLPSIFCPAIRDFKGERVRHLSGYEAVGPPLRAPAAVSTKSWLCLLLWDGHAMDPPHERRNIRTRGEKPLVLTRVEPLSSMDT